MGRSKRKNNSPLQKDGGKSRRTADEDGDDIEGDDGSQGGQDDVLADLKDFIRSENARNSKNLADEIRRCNEERITAIETSLSFALATNETLSKRLVEVEQRARRTEAELINCTKRLCMVEEQLDQAQQRELQDWLVFSGPAISRLLRSGRGDDAFRLLRSMIQQYMNIQLDVTQLREVYRDERQIRVRFTAAGERSDRHQLVRNKTKLRGSGLYIRERLTPFRQKIFNELMQFKMAQQVNSVFTRDGTVFVVVGQRDRPRPVRSEAAVERIVQLLLETESNSPRQTGAPGSQQTHARGWTGPAEETRGRNTPRPEDGLVYRGDTEPEQHTGPPRHASSGGRVSADRDQHQLPADDSMTATGADRERLRSAQAAAPAPPRGSGSSPDGVRVDLRRAPPGGEDGDYRRSSAASERATVMRSGGRPTDIMTAAIDDSIRPRSAQSTAPTPPAGSGSSSDGARVDPRPAPPGDEDGNSGHPPAASDRAPGGRAGGRLHAPGTSTSGVRQRFRGDMRQFVTIHSKSD